MTSRTTAETAGDRRHSRAPPWPSHHPPSFIVVLSSSPRSARHNLSLSDLHDLILSSPSRPLKISSTFPHKLLFRCFADALDASLFLWARRLDGAHLLTPSIQSSQILTSQRLEESARLKSLFADHIQGLLSCVAVRRCEMRIDNVGIAIGNVQKMLKKPKAWKVVNELRGKLETLEVEREHLKGRLGEFTAAMECLLRGISGEGTGSGVVVNVEIFKVGKELDWNRIHWIMMRECRRLEEGLPMYSFRREILSKIASQQVIVLNGETGSGKSTQLVQFLADAGFGEDGAILCTQPRKIAAISLAQRVGDESIGCYQSNFVLSYPTYSSFQVFGPGVIFMTDNCLLQHYMNDSSLDRISFIVVDEAHERSLNTDLLLALIKRKLLENENLRLIIMSATADATKIAEYFFGCWLFSVKGRKFPVEIEYVPDISSRDFHNNNSNDFSGCAEYVKDVLKMVSIIHKTEEDGAVLAFLTSQMEVEWACELFSEPSAVVLPMHGKLSSEEQNYVFQNYPGKRKIIFCTNIAETSLTIKDIKYVVDSGMVKESRFEAASGMNVLKVVRISQSSANQRAGRAGRTRSGKCFRLYSEHDYLAMKKHQEPEIHKVHLGIAVLRIISLGINNVQDFEFVDAPCPKMIDIAIKNLVHLGAVTFKNGAFELTDCGWNLVKLGIEPRLGKIILDCFDRGLRKEGLVLASVMANSSSIFCRVGSEEDKFKADRLRIPFCHRDGDLFTLLSVYKRWEAERSNKNTWCWQNSINAKSMRRCQETVSELESCLQHELNIIIPSYWFWNPVECNEYNKSLKKVILSSLLENVAMYSGNDSLGYEVALTGKHFQLHPSSSLLMYAQKPDWVVFGEILSLSNQYLVCVTAVDYESILTIQPPLFDVQQLESRKMQLHAITGLGNNLLKRLSGKSNHNLQRILSLCRQACADENVNINIDFDKNEIHIYASAKNMDDVTLVVQDALDYEAKLLREECFEKKLFPSRPGSSTSIALFGSGAEIKHLELDMRYLAVEILHPNAHTFHDKELLMMVEKYVSGIANYHKYTSSAQEGAEVGKWGRITFLTPEIAENAVSKLNKMEFCGAMLEVLPVRICDQKSLPFPAVKARVCWPRKPSKGVAFISCAPGEAEFVVRDCFTLGIGNMYVTCQVSDKAPNRVFATGIPREASEAEVFEAFRSSTNRKILDVHLLRGPLAVNNSVVGCREALIHEISAFMPKKNLSDEHFRVEVFDPEPKDYMMKAVITFDGTLHLEAAKALGHIEGKVLRGCLPWQKIQFQQEFHSSVSFPSRVYMVIKNELDSLLESFKCEKGVVYKLEQNLNGYYRVKISANATKTIADLRRPLEDLMKGKIITHPDFTPAVLQLLLSRDGISIMRAVEHDTGAYILYDRHNLNVRVFGPPKNVFLATEKLVSSLVSLHERRKLEIRLRSRCLPSNLMKEVVQRFGSDMQGLHELVPEAEITLNARRHALYISGSMESKEKVENIIYDVAQSIDQYGTIDRPPESSCPICLCEPEKPYILEACGHHFCQNCLIEQCESAIRSHEGFPLCCTKENCKNPILTVDLRALLSSEKLEELFRASLSAFVASSGGAYRFCPSPDCPSVYRVGAQDEEARPFACGACLVETCTKCHLEYHPLISCERYKEYKDDPDLSLLEWCNGKNNVRKCPVCGHTIEKTDGCNHVACRCGIHICWLCGEAFKASDECYSHLRGIHSSY